ncbi:MAG: hypothetical protein SAJ12_13850 [Jaaginema sp. PMC 1079.18]|nr:hypothetical protein [Jaaginema sp. PMC 1080.18]MEC4852065.1 hypothetical protein [Jaaginema sp. PMC 1079.18]
MLPHGWSQTQTDSTRRYGGKDVKLCFSCFFTVIVSGFYLDSSTTRSRSPL